ncbi:MAG: hypothetical protein SGI92_20675 [Bryobacteraceae bacterium]|nr:hypothetical protein [Bryobacteraceae bacterium]
MKLSHFAVIAGMLLLVSCSSEAPKKKEAKKAGDPVAARYAFHQTLLTARTWAQDLQVLRVRSVPVEIVKADPGKAAIWEVTFVSAAKSKARRYTYSVVETPSIHEGVYGGLDEDWSGRDGQATGFLPAAFRIDSTEAWEKAAAQSKDYMAKNPDMPVTFLLEKTPRHPDPTWRVIWGTSVSTSGYSIFVDASTGEFVEKAR